MTKILAFLRGLPAVAYLGSILAAGTVVGVAYFIHAQRAIGAANEVVKRSAYVADSLEKILLTERGKLRVDTVRTIKRLDHWDSVTALNGALDSAKAAIARAQAVRGAKPETVTVRVPAVTVVGADSAIRACRETISECGRVASMEKARGDALSEQVAALKRLTPGLLSRCGVQAGYGAVYALGPGGGVKAGPAVTAGCRLFP